MWRQRLQQCGLLSVKGVFFKFLNLKNLKLRTCLPLLRAGKNLFGKNKLNLDIFLKQILRVNLYRTGSIIVYCFSFKVLTNVGFFSKTWSDTFRSVLVFEQEQESRKKIRADELRKGAVVTKYFAWIFNGFI